MAVPNSAFKIQRRGRLRVGLVWDDEGHLDLAEGKEEYLQANLLGVLMQQGDWAFALRWGLPWIKHPNLPRGRRWIMGAKPPLDAGLIQLYVKQQLLREPRNRIVSQPAVWWEDEGRRKLRIEAQIVSVDDENITVSV